jgi:uncharacterized membrane protein
MKHRGRRAILWAKLGVAGAEVAIGVALLVVRAAHIDLTHSVRSLALHELSEDPGDFVARHALVLAPSLGPGTAVRAGALLAVYGAFKAAVVAGVLLRRARAVLIGAIAFAVIAAGAFVALALHPTLPRLVLGALDIAVACAIVLEARDLRRVSS